MRIILKPTKAGIIAQSQRRQFGIWRKVSTSVPHKSIGLLFADLGQMLTSVFGESAGILPRHERKRIAKACAASLVKRMAR